MGIDWSLKIENKAQKDLSQYGIAEFAEILEQTLQEHGIKKEGKPFVMRYNPPWTPTFMRRNEVALLVKT